jgi:predicted transcriptional regulator
MSMVLINPSRPDRIHYVHLFARLVRDRRRALCLTVARAAELTGITTSEWIALEAGHVPAEYKTIRTISETLEVRTSDLLMASIMSRLSQEQVVQ